MNYWIDKYRIVQNMKTMIAVIMVLFVILIQFNNSFFLHEHKLSDGTVVFHSHFALSGNKDTEGSAAASHTHSAIQQLFYFLASILDQFLIIALFILSIQLKKLFKFVTTSPIPFQENIIPQYIPRSPPTFNS